MILQLNPTIPIICPKGTGHAIGWIDYSSEHDLLWICLIAKTGECWIIPNKDIRAQTNYSMARGSGVDSKDLI